MIYKDNYKWRPGGAPFGGNPSKRGKSSVSVVGQPRFSNVTSSTVDVNVTTSKPVTVAHNTNIQQNVSSSSTSAPHIAPSAPHILSDAEISIQADENALTNITVINLSANNDIVDVVEKAMSTLVYIQTFDAVQLDILQVCDVA